VTAANVASLTIDATRARVSCRPRLVIRSTGAVRVRFVNCPRR
jgi:hypothetical protein